MSSIKAACQERLKEEVAVVREPFPVPSAPTKAQIEWHGAWCATVNEAFASLPYDPLMDPALVRGLWEDGVGRDRQKIALVRSLQGDAVGVVPLRRRGRMSWQLVTQYVMPYARFFVKPGYTDSALAALGRHIDCDNIAFYEVPAGTRMLRPEESWVVPLEPCYEELMRRTRYRKEDRQCRRYAESLDLLEDRFEALPEALEYWQWKWQAAGSLATARRKDDLLLGFRFLAQQGRLKTFSLYAGSALAAMEMNMIAGGTMFSMTTIMRDEYRHNHAGIRLTLAAMEWGCENGLAEYDMLRTSGHYKRRWAKPMVRGYRLVRSPFGFEGLGCAIEGTKEFLRNLRHREGSK